MDAFELSKHHYLAVVDKYSGWILIFHVKCHPTRKHAIDSLRSIFCVYGAPECLFTDGGLPFQAHDFDVFLKRWNVKHVTSSAFYPQGNGRAELAVKTAKRLLHDNTAPDGTLNCEKACRALLQYRNTPIQNVGLSPAQILFHRNLRDDLPVNPSTLQPCRLWLEAANKREEALCNRNQALSDRYNQTTRNLCPISVGEKVLIQEPDKKNRWSRSGVVAEVNDRKYFIRMDGSGRVISRNRKFIKPIPGDENRQVELDAALFQPETSSSPPNQTSQEITAGGDEVMNRDEETVNNQSPLSDNSVVVSKVPRMLQRLMPYNQPGLNETPI